MAQVQPQIIKRITVNKDFTVAIEFDGGYKGTVDFKPIILRGGVFKNLGDMQFFRRAKIGGHGRILIWPGELEFCADALYMTAEQNAKISA